MRLTIKEVEDKQVWEEFLINSHPNTFLQNWNWGEFNQKIGRKIYRLGVFDSEKLTAVALLIKHQTQLGSYLYCPRGPVLDWENLPAFDLILEKAKQIANQESAIFVKFDPLLEESPQNRDIFKKRRFVPAVSFVQVEDAWLLPIEPPEAEILAGMRKTTRYLIKHESEAGTEVQITSEASDIKEFVDLLYSTSARKNFVNHPKDYYIKQFEILAKDDQMKIFAAARGGKTLAMAVVAFYGDSAYYLHGASVKDAKSAGYPLQWAAIKEAKRRGLKTYNFWGVVKDKNFHPGHPWYGFSLFKRGFGGYKYTYIRAQDLPLSPKYWVYRYAEKSRRLLNRLKSGYWED